MARLPNGKKLPGKLFVVEGIDGSGKSTQLDLLRKWLISEGHCVAFSEWNSSQVVRSTTRRGKKKQLLSPITFSLIHAADFADLFRRHIPGVVLLQSCEGAALSSWQAFTGTASQLVDQNIPIVIAMQYKVSNITASRFSVEFYKQLAAGVAVDTAVQEGRRMISLGMYGYDQRDFATPVLFMRARQGYFFTTTAAEEHDPGGSESGMQPDGKTVINPGGGAYIGGSVNTGGGAFVGRDQVKTSPSPSGGGAVSKPSLAHVRALTTALLECVSMRDQATRDAIVDMLPDELSAGIKRSRSARLDTTNILKVCLGRPGAMAELFASLRFFEGNSFAMRDFTALAEALNLHNP